MADWDDDNFEPTGFEEKSNTDKWEGEDEEDDSVKDNWDDDDDESQEKKEEVQVAEESMTAKTAKKKRTLKDAIKEKEAKKLEEQKLKEEMRKKLEEESKPMTQEEIMAEKLRQQKLVEDSDLLLAMDTFGSNKDELTGKNNLDSMNPSNREEFTEYSKLLVEKLSKLETNPCYVQFLEDTLRDLCASMEPDDIKKLSHCLNLLHTEKIKAQKGKTKGKTKPKKVALTGGKAGRKDDMDYNDYGNEFDDFM